MHFSKVLVDASAFGGGERVRVSRFDADNVASFAAHLARACGVEAGVLVEQEDDDFGGWVWISSLDGVWKKGGFG